MLLGVGSETSCGSPCVTDVSRLCAAFVVSITGSIKLASSVSEMVSESVVTPDEAGNVCARGEWSGCVNGVDVVFSITIQVYVGILYSEYVERNRVSVANVTAKHVMRKTQKTDQRAK